MKGPGKEANTTRVISPPQMLDMLKEADSLLDDIQKGWSDYLEEKTLPLFSKVNSLFPLSVACVRTKICLYKGIYKSAFKNRTQSFQVREYCRDLPV